MSSDFRLSRFNQTRETVSTLLMVLPFPMAAIYLLLAARATVIPCETILIHYVTVTFWTLSTVLLVTITEYLLPSASWARKLTALVPAFGNTTLFFLYASAITGLLNWGQTPDWKILRASAPHILNTGKAIGIPTLVGALLLVSPPLFAFLLHLAAPPSIRNKALLAPATFAAKSVFSGHLIWTYIFCWGAAGLFLHWVTPLPERWQGEPVLGLFGFFRNLSG